MGEIQIEVMRFWYTYQYGRDIGTSLARTSIRTDTRWWEPPTQRQVGGVKAATGLGGLSAARQTNPHTLQVRCLWAHGMAWPAPMRGSWHQKDPKQPSEQMRRKQRIWRCVTYIKIRCWLCKNCACVGGNVSVCFLGFMVKKRIKETLP